MLTDINLTDIPDFVYQFEDAELVKGAGYRDLLLYCRLLPGAEDKTEGCRWLQYDISYLEEGFGSDMLKLIDIDEQNVIECSISTETIAERADRG